VVGSGTLSIREGNENQFTLMKNHERTAKAVREVIKMGVDHDTEAKFVNIVVDDNPAYKKILKRQADDDGQNEDGRSAISITQDNHGWRTEEYYLEDGNLIISGELTNAEGSTFIALDMPISDTVLIDIMQMAIKKLGKLKTALETLKD